MNLTFKDIKNKEKNILICGLGYVGLPLAVELGKKYNVIGFDVSTQKVNELKNNVDVTGEIDSSEIKAANITFTTSPTDLKNANVIIVTVPTPINGSNKPDLTIIKAATKMIGQNLVKDSIIIYESTVYPGLTEDVCLPILEKESGLIFGKDFTLGYSPERLSPGDSNHTLTKIMKIVSGSDENSANLCADLYSSIIPAGVHKAACIKVAEAAKVIENTQRDLNVALMNELSIIFSKMGINTLDVIEAASTKWNFMKMTPGLVGGHCIGVDPYYLTHKAEELGYSPEVILSGRRINDSMGKYVAQETVKLLIKADKRVKDSNILVLGLTFKENVADIRNSKVVDVINELNEYGVKTHILDPHANAEETQHEYGLSLSSYDDIDEVDAVILAVNHKAYTDEEQLISKYLSKIKGQRILIDIKNIFKDSQEVKSNCDFYWSL